MFDKVLVWLSLLDGVFLLGIIVYILSLIRYSDKKGNQNGFLESEYGLTNELTDESSINELECFSVCDSAFLKRECGK